MVQISGSSDRHIVDLKHGDYEELDQKAAAEPFVKAAYRVNRVEATGLPFLPMSMAKGLLPDYHPQSTAAARSLALRRADVVALVGARLNWLLGHGQAPQWSPQAQFIQVDIDAIQLVGRIVLLPW